MRRAIAAAALAAVLLAGCGGESETVTKDRYITRADEVCASLAEGFAAGAADPTTPREIARSADVLADRYGELVDRIDDIELPTDPAARRGAAAYVAELRRNEPRARRLRAAAQRLVAAADGEDREALGRAGIEVRSALDAFRAGQARADRLALDYGFAACGNLS
ncbi:MAG TPA: hypothetical protein VM299_04465 [Solirubrobacteraceae bacterium]|nr:hypothetical protein [Solirubrobacteraceae bacterium]